MGGQWIGRQTGVMDLVQVFGASQVLVGVKESRKRVGGCESGLKESK